MKKLFTIIALTISASLFSAEAIQSVNITVTKKGFEPDSLNLKPGIATELKVTRKTDSTCATQIVIPSKKINQELPLNKTVTVALGKLEKGEVKFSCSMDMISGVINVK